MFGRQVLVLKVGSHGTVEDENLVLKGVKVAAVGVFPFHAGLLYQLFTDKKPLAREVYKTCRSLSSLRIPSAGVGTRLFARLPRFLRAGPSTSLDERVTFTLYGEDFTTNEIKETCQEPWV
jgi:hypothetical protein